MEHTEMPLNYVAILVAVLANFVLGWLWYGPLFGKAWAREMGMSMDVKPSSGMMAKGMILMVIGCFLTAYVLASNAFAWKNDMPAETPAVVFGFMGGFFTWLGFFLPQQLSGVAWERRSWKFFGINATYHFVALQLVAMIIAFMG